MTTKEKLIIESISRIEKRLEEINKINEATPLIDLINVKKETQTTLSQRKEENENKK